ncbi:MAG: M48 family metallopeptidase [Xanthobacteraceae bacterium]
MTDTAAGPDQAPITPPVDESDYFDGTSSHKHRVTLRIGAGLDIVEDGNVIANWPFDTIRRADGPQRMLRLRSVSALPLARLEIEDEATIATLLQLCPSLDAERGGPGQTRRIVLWSIAAVCSILVVAIYGIPYAADRLAPFVPFAVEKRIGEAVDTQVRAILGGKECVSAEGQAAYAKLVGKLKTAGGVDLPIDAKVLSHKMANALALPGGKVHLIDGLLQKARNVDEVAGVLAHEIGHVIHRDSLRRVMQAGGTSFLVGLLLGDVFGGGAIIFVAQTMLEASYSRDAEQQADAFAIEVMHKLGRSPRPLGELLVRISGSEVKDAKDAKNGKKGKKGRGFTLINSHPLTQDRLDMMKKVDRGNTGPELLTASEWRALRSICATP